MGASWKAALYRTIGSTCGALAAALLVPLLGNGPVGVRDCLVSAGNFIRLPYVAPSRLHRSGVHCRLILVFGGQGEPWHMAWLRVLYTILGAVIAFAVGALIWPVHARVGLRHKIASILNGAGALYRAVTAAALQGIDDEQQVRQLGPPVARSAPRHHSANGRSAQRARFFALQSGRLSGFCRPCRSGSPPLECDGRGYIALRARAASTWAGPVIARIGADERVAGFRVPG